MQNVNIPSSAAQRRPQGIFSRSPDGEVTVTSVTVFSAMLRPKKNQPAPTSAIFQISAGNKNAEQHSTRATRPEEIIDHSQALSLSRLSKPRGQVSAIHSASPSDARDFGPRIQRK